MTKVVYMLFQWHTYSKSRTIVPGDITNSKPLYATLLFLLFIKTNSIMKALFCSRVIISFQAATYFKSNNTSADKNFLWLIKDDGNINLYELKRPSTSVFKINFSLLVLKMIFEICYFAMFENVVSS